MSRTSINILVSSLEELKREINALTQEDFDKAQSEESEFYYLHNDWLSFELEGNYA